MRSLHFDIDIDIDIHFDIDIDHLRNNVPIQATSSRWPVQRVRSGLTIESIFFLWIDYWLLNISQDWLLNQSFSLCYKYWLNIFLFSVLQQLTQSFFCYKYWLNIFSATITESIFSRSGLTIDSISLIYKRTHLTKMSSSNVIDFVFFQFCHNKAPKKK